MYIQRTPHNPAGRFNQPQVSNSDYYSQTLVNSATFGSDLQQNIVVATRLIQQLSVGLSGVRRIQSIITLFPHVSLTSPKVPFILPQLFMCYHLNYVQEQRGQKTDRRFRL